MKKLIPLYILFPLLINSICTFGQWKYESGGNAFDGNYKTSYVRGSGGEFPYNEPTLVVNKFEYEPGINVYLKGIGYLGCENLKLYFKFDNYDTLYISRPSTDVAKETAFIGGVAYESNRFDLTRYDFLFKLMSNGILYVRVSDNCKQRDYMFPLSGSSRAIKFVAGDYLNALKEENRSIKKRNKGKSEVLESDNIEIEDRIGFEKGDQYELINKGKIHIKESLRKVVIKPHPVNDDYIDIEYHYSSGPVNHHFEKIK